MCFVDMCYWDYATGHCSNDPTVWHLTEPICEDDSLLTVSGKTENPLLDGSFHLWVIASFLFFFAFLGTCFLWKRKRGDYELIE